MNYGMTLAVAVRALARNKTRSLLTALGIIIGIAAVIAVVAVGQGAAVMIKAQISSMGNNIAMIFPGSTRAGGFHGGAGTQQTLTAEDGEALRESPFVVAMSPLVRSAGQCVYRENDWATSIQGVGVEFPQVRNWTVVEGDFFGEADVRGAVRACVLGLTVATNLFGAESPVGQTIRIRNMPFRVLGVLAAKGTAAWGQDQDDTVLAPYTTVRRVLQRSAFNSVNQIMVSLTTLEAFPQARSEFAAILRQRHRLAPGADDDFTIMDMTEVTQTITKVATLMTVLLTVVAAISLVVGGIGIMNIMLVAVSERTREIGLRMAVGARRRDILAQFLTEAIVLSAAGGAIGIALGTATARILARANSWPVLISPSAVLIALAFSAGVGIFFGFYPAWRAARLNPIESLRRE